MDSQQLKHALNLKNFLKKTNASLKLTAYTSFNIQRIQGQPETKGRQDGRESDKECKACHLPLKSLSVKGSKDKAVMRIIRRCNFCGHRQRKQIQFQQDVKAGDVVEKQKNESKKPIMSKKPVKKLEGNEVSIHMSSQATQNLAKLMASKKKTCSLKDYINALTT